MEERPSVWRVAANVLNKQFWAADKGWSSSLGVGRGAYNSSPKKLTLIRNGYASLGPGLILRYDLSNGKETSFGTWNVGSLYSLGSLTTIAARELSRYKSDLVGVQGVRWDKGGTVRAGNYIFSMKKETKIIKWEQDFSCTKNSVSSQVSRGC